MEVNKKQLADIFGASIRTIQNWQEQGMPVLRGGGKGNEVLYDSAAVIKWYAERDAEIENEKRRCTRTYCRYWCSYALGCDWLTWTHHHR